MRDPSQNRSFETKTKTVGKRAASSLQFLNQVPAEQQQQIEPTERDPLLAKNKNTNTIEYKIPTSSIDYTKSLNKTSIKRRHQSPTFQNASQPSMTTSQTGPSFSGSGTKTTPSTLQQHLYIPPLPGREHNQLQDSTDSSFTDFNNDINNTTGTHPHHHHRRGGAGGASSENRDMNDDFRQQYYNERAARLLGDSGSEDENSSSVVEVPEEIYAVRKNALTVMEPLIYTSLIFSAGISLSIALGLSRLTKLLPKISFWLVLLPAWLSHVGMLFCHILSAKALSTFISSANENRQRLDSTDHLDRTEYLPLLQRALKFGLKTGLLSFCLLAFELLIYFRVSRGSISLAVTFTPMWIVVIGGILEGIICTSQNLMRVMCWLLAFTGMLLVVLKVDKIVDVLSWRLTFTPILLLLILSSIFLVYIVYGHQIGYYRLTESQLTAGILYSASSLVSIVLVIIFAEVLTSNRPMELQIRLFITFLAPLVIALVGLGAWAVCRDEFNRLLLYGGQSSIFPKKLRLEPNGWKCVEGRGVVIIPLFGEVSFEPLDARKSHNIEMCNCCACYPLEDEDDSASQYDRRTANAYPGLSINQTSSNFTQGNPSILGVGQNTF